MFKYLKNLFFPPKPQQIGDDYAHRYYTKDDMEVIEQLPDHLKQLFHERKPSVEKNEDTADFIDEALKDFNLSATLDDEISELIEQLGDDSDDEDLESFSEPKVILKGTSYDKDKGIKIELDWNAAFVKYLRNSGITGSSDDQIVQKWLALLYKDMIDGMTETNDTDDLV